MKLKYILLLNFVIIIKPLSLLNDPVDNYLDLAEVEENINNNSEKITKQQSNNIQKYYYNKHNHNITKSPISIFTSILKTASVKLDQCEWIDLICKVRVATEKSLLKENFDNNNINNHRIVDIFIISIFCIKYTDILEITSKDEETKTFLNTIYSNISDKQKKIINEALDKEHEKIFGSKIRFKYKK